MIKIHAMTGCKQADPFSSIGACVALFVVLLVGPGFAEKIMVYDEQRGIIFVDKDEKTGKPATEKKETEPAMEETKKVTRTVVKQGLTRATGADIHVGRKKDPPELYFSSGLEYFKNGDYYNALKNFYFADSVNPQPRYALWLGKTYRRLDESGKMLDIMQGILDKYPKSDVADDALFEIAFYYQTLADYEKAGTLYTQLSEQYPFGTSYSNGEEFREVAQEQRRYMRAEMVNLLTLLGYGNEDLAEAYKEFQRAHNIEATGTGNRETVLAIKKLHADYLAKESQKSSKEEQAGKYVIYGIIAGSIALLNIILLIAVRSITASKKRQLDIMKQSLDDLNVQKI